jgi:hypothetical protein
MVVLAALCLALLAEQVTVFSVALLWFLFNAFQNGEYARGCSPARPPRTACSS